MNVRSCHGMAAAMTVYQRLLGLLSRLFTGP